MSIDAFPGRQLVTPSALLAFVPLPAASGIVGATQLGPTIPLSMRSGRTYKITAHIAFNSTVIGDLSSVRIYEDGVHVGQDRQYFGGSNAWLHAVTIVTPSTGMHDYHITIDRSAGTGTIAVVDGTSANRVSYVLIEDITGGGAGEPGGTKNFSPHTGTQSFTATETNLNNYSANFVVTAGRTIRIKAQGHAYTNAGSAAALFQLRDNGVLIGGAQVSTVLNSLVSSEWTLEHVYSPAPGAHSIQVTAQMNWTSGAASCTNRGSSNESSFLLIEDISSTPAPANNTPSSTLGYFELKSGGPVVYGTTKTEIPGMVVTVNVGEGRRLKITGRCYVENQTGATQSAYLDINEGATRLHFDQKTFTASPGGNGTLAAEVVVTPTPGDHTYKLMLGATGNFNWYAGPTYPTFILVEDITGVGVPGHTHPQLDGIDDTGWIAPTLINNWANYGGSWVGARYRRKNGIVYLQGLIKNGTSGVDAFILPAGFRPPVGTILMNTSVSGEPWTVTRVDINGTTGGVAVTRPGNTWANLTCSFPADS